MLFSNDGVSANHAKFSLILGEDSISHPDIKVNYLDKQKVFQATRQEDGVGLQPFVTPVHLNLKSRWWSGLSAGPLLISTVDEWQAGASTVSLV